MPKPARAILATLRRVAILLPLAAALGFVCVLVMPTGHHHPHGRTTTAASASASATATDAARTSSTRAAGRAELVDPRAEPLPPLPAGDYVLWQKSRARVVFVRDGVPQRVAPTTGNLEKTPPGVYRMMYRLDPGSETVDGVTYRLPRFQAFGPVPGRTGIAIHGVPVTADGRYIQPLDTVGRPGYSSHGCLRLLPDDAEYAWRFLHVGSLVRVID